MNFNIILSSLTSSPISCRCDTLPLRTKDPPPRIFLDSSKPNPRISHLSIKLRSLLWPPPLLQLTTNSSLFHFATQANVRGIIWYNAKWYSTVKQNSKLHCWGQTILQWGKFQQSTMQCTASIPFPFRHKTHWGWKKKLQRLSADECYRLSACSKKYNAAGHCSAIDRN